MSMNLAHCGITTPRIFLIPEVCREICEFVALSENFDKATCRAFASTCKDIYGPALDVIWYDSRNLKGLLNYCREGAAASVVGAAVSVSTLFSDH